MSGAYLYGWDSVNKVWIKLKGTATGKLIIDPSLILENPPTEDEEKKAPSSEWAFDHEADASAHHAKYTDDEALAACGLDGNQYWSCPASHFDAQYPDLGDIDKTPQGYFTVTTGGICPIATVILPHGAKVTVVIVYGTAATEDDEWFLEHVKLSTGAHVVMASGDMNTADETITDPVIDNSLYGYFLRTTELATGDILIGARITYTL